MRKFFIALVALLLIVSTSFGQDWTEGVDDETEYNCLLIQEIIEEFGDQPFVRNDAVEQSFAEFASENAPDCLSSGVASQAEITAAFKVTVKSTINLRECAGTECEIVGKTQPGEIYDVLAEDYDWYEIRFERGTAFIAGWLTSRLPDAVVETDEALYVFAGSCVIVPDSSRSTDMDINVIITGDRKNAVNVDLYRPDNDEPLPVYRQLDKTFIDTGGTYILQTYHWNVWWPTGLYTIDVLLDGDIEKIAWNVTERADYNVFVSCD